MPTRIGEYIASQQYLHAVEHLNQAIKIINSYGINEIGAMADIRRTLEEHQEGVLNYYDYPISTGPLEGTNTKIQLMKRQAYGFRDFEFFKLKILALHETKHALVG